MQKGDRVSFDGRAGTVVNFMPAGMVDVRFDDVDRVERRHGGRLARANPSDKDDEDDRKDGFTPRLPPVPPRSRHDALAYQKPQEYQPGEFRSLYPVESKRLKKLESAESFERSSTRSLQSRSFLQAELKRLGLSATGTTKKLRERYEEHQARVIAERMTGRSTGGGVVKKRDTTPAQRGPPVGVSSMYEKPKYKKEPKEYKGPPAKRKQQVSVRSQTETPKVGLLTREDPPRRVGRTYCGNPIDGTAYYVLLSRKDPDVLEGGRARWITAADLSKFIDVKGEGGHVIGERSVEEQIEAFEEDRVSRYGRGNVSVFISRAPALSPHAQEIRMGKTKRTQGSTKRLRPEQLVGIEKRPDYSPPPSNVVTTPILDEDGEPTREKNWWKIKITQPVTARLKNYSIYAKREFLVPPPTVGELKLIKKGIGPLAIAVARGGGFSYDVAEWMIKSGMVKIAADRESLWRSFPETRTIAAAPEGYTIQTQDRAKASSPFFSFVEMDTSPLPDPRRKGKPGGQYPACLTEAEKDLANLLGSGASRLKSYLGKLGWVQGIFQKLARDQPVRGDHAREALVELLKSNVSLSGWFLELEGNELAFDAASGGYMDEERESPVYPERERFFNLEESTNPLKVSLEKFRVWLETGGGQRFLKEKREALYPAEGKPSLLTERDKGDEDGRANDAIYVKELHELLQPYNYAIKPKEIEAKWFGKSTLNAVKRFQADYNVSISSTMQGTVTDRTWAALGPIPLLIGLSEIQGFAPKRKGRFAAMIHGSRNRAARWQEMGIEYSLTQQSSRVSREERGDQLEAINQAVYSGKHTVGDDIALRRVLYALAYAYYALDGWRLGGPLADQAKRRELEKKGWKSPLTIPIKYLRKAKANLKGGAESLKAGGADEVAYVTYNPFLFRLFAKTDQTTFQPLKDTYVTYQIDVVGRYGAILKWVHFLEMKKPVIPVQEKLQAYFDMIRRIKGSKHQMRMEKSGKYTPFLLFSRLGLRVWDKSRTGTASDLSEGEAFASDPIGYLRGLKVRVEEAFAYLSRGKVRGQKSPWSYAGRAKREVKSIELQDPDRAPPYVYTEDTSPVPRSILSRADKRRKEIERYLDFINEKLSAMGVDVAPRHRPVEQDAQKAPLKRPGRYQAPLPERPPPTPPPVARSQIAVDGEELYASGANQLPLRVFLAWPEYMRNSWLYGLPLDEHEDVVKDLIDALLLDHHGVNDDLVKRLGAVSAADYKFEEE